MIQALDMAQKSARNLGIPELLKTAATARYSIRQNLNPSLRQLELEFRRISQEAERYRFGQLLLETELVIYDAKIGVKTQADVDRVTAAYDQAQKVLSGGLSQLVEKVSRGLDSPERRP